MSGIPPVGAFSEPQLRQSRAAPLSPKRISSFRPSDEELAHETLPQVTVVGSEESRTLLSPRIAPDGRKKISVGRETADTNPLHPVANHPHSNDVHDARSA